MKRFTNEELKALFPLEVVISQELLDNAELFSILNCNGARALKEALEAKGASNAVSWGDTWGSIYEGSEIGHGDYINVHAPVNMMLVKEPTTMTFSLESSHPNTIWI